MREWFTALSLAAMAAWLGCGARAELDEPSETSGATVIGSHVDGGSGVDAGVQLGEDAGVNDQDGCTVVPPPPAPSCAISSTCGAEYFPPGYGKMFGTFNLETISVSCRLTPATVQQDLDGGTWVSLARFVPNAAEPDSWTPNVFDTGLQWPLNYPPQGATVGSVQSIRACTIASPSPGACAGSTMTCDRPSNVTISDCLSCPPTSCGYGYSLSPGSCLCEPIPCPCGGLWPNCNTICSGPQ